MDTKALLRITGIIGFIMAVITTYLYVTYILIPAITPILIHQIETQLGSEGVSISQGDISGFISFMKVIMPITTLVGLVIGWLIEAAILMALLRAFRINAGFMDTWLLSGNYFYVSVVQMAVTVATPLLEYSINAVAMHHSVLSEPVILAVGLAFVVMAHYS